MDNESIIHVSASFGLEQIRSVLFSTVAIVYYYYIVYVVLKLIMLHRNSDRRVVLKPWQESLNEAWKNGVAWRRRRRLLIALVLWSPTLHTA